MENTLWKLFETTGNIEAYLSYTHFKKYNNRMKEKEKVIYDEKKAK
ncbi:YqzL-like protein [Natranaerovirga hydrolytica]|uniref:YqzL-like protein n=1 Tax=Natranaerovirga hydrolytica TaxID=680378 RepID=A0A4R1MZQ1_9FIRM|nr:YqzL family protein [Natranaerovirga hydrolytica]TCK98766.1 YqzL-like protein [Natranaerovirga hydrolytica]